MLVVDDDFVVVSSAFVIVDDCAEVCVVVLPDDVVLVVVASDEVVAGSDVVFAGFDEVVAGVDDVVCNSKLDDFVASGVDVVPGSSVDVVCMVVEVVVGCPVVVGVSVEVVIFADVVACFDVVFASIVELVTVDSADVDDVGFIVTVVVASNSGFVADIVVVVCPLVTIVVVSIVVPSGKVSVEVTFGARDVDAGFEEEAEAKVERANELGAEARVEATSGVEEITAAKVVCTTCACVGQFLLGPEPSVEQPAVMPGTESTVGTNPENIANPNLANEGR